MSEVYSAPEIPVWSTSQANVQLDSIRPGMVVQFPNGNFHTVSEVMYLTANVMDVFSDNKMVIHGLVNEIVIRQFSVFNDTDWGK
jgi:hypothetical protein